MRFLVDAQLPPSLAEWLRRTGHEAEHVEEIGLRSADNSVIRAYAVRAGSIIVTKDRDFVPAVGEHAGVLKIVWIRTGNISNRILLQRVEAAWPSIIAHLEAGARIVELR